MNWSRILLYGIGWSQVPYLLLQRGYHAVGCDLWKPLIVRRQAELGHDKFYHRDDLPSHKFELISAFEVFEHFINPLKEIAFLAKRLAVEGAIVGCSDFWHGGPLKYHPNPDNTYWRHRVHVSAWTYDSMRYVASQFGLEVSFFKVDTEGFAAKVFFILHRGERTKAFVNSIPIIIRGAF